MITCYNAEASKANQSKVSFAQARTACLVC